MNPERLQQIEELYHLASERAPSERESFLKDACQSDPDLFREVWVLVAQAEVSGPMEQPALKMAANLLGQTPVEWTPGMCVGPYRILSRIGVGGMGDVFRARDTRLGRDVAIKTSKEGFGGRFQREARAISSLNHANICTLHDVG